MKIINIAEYLGLEKSALAKSQAAFRRARLETCDPETQKIHAPIADSEAVWGFLNPAGLGNAEEFSRLGRLGQTCVAFDSDGQYYEAADKAYSVNYGSAEYAITLSTEAAALRKKVTTLHNGKGAIICPSGLSAISTTIDAFEPTAVLMPENAFFAAGRYLREQRKVHPILYPVSALTTAADVSGILDNALAQHGAEKVMLWMEAPGSGTSEIPDIGGLADLAKSRGVRTVMDNTWATHFLFRPLDHKIDVAIESLSKYAAGYGDTPGGVAIAGNDKDAALLQRTQKIAGNGAVSPQTCARTFYRIDDVEQRLDQHFATAQQLMGWFSRQTDIVGDILCPALPNSPDNARFNDYFGGKGNGLFSIVFKPDVPVEKVKQFVNGLAFFRISEGFGAHVSLVMRLNSGNRISKPWPQGSVVRFSAGLEHAGNLERDLDQAATHAFGPATGARGQVQGRREPNPGQRNEI